MKRIIALFKVFFITLLCNVTSVTAQNTNTVINDSVIANPYHGVEVYLLTCDPHDEIYSLYGHTAIRVKNPHNNTDIAINFGAFDSSEDYFILRFVFGLTDYMMRVVPFEYFVREFQYYGCAVHQQHVNMADDEKKQFLEALAISARPENIVYRYNYFYNNCTTKARDLLLNSINGEARVERLSSDLPVTFRQLIHSMNEDHRWARWGNDILLGVKADLSTSIEEQEFLPRILMQDFNSTTIIRPNGEETPLINEDYIVIPAGTPYHNNGIDFPYTPQQCSIVFACVILAWVLARRFYPPLSANTAKYKNICQRIDYAICCLYAIPGLLLFCMIFSQHPTVSFNLQILLFNPLLFWLANPHCKWQYRWHVVMGCVLAFGAGSFIQDYAEGMIMLAFPLLAISNLNLFFDKEEQYRDNIDS